MVADAFRDAGLEGGREGFEYIYHNQVHTSLVGIRELANTDSICLQSDEHVDDWLQTLERRPDRTNPLQLLAYPGQSNMNGHRPDPERRWCRSIRHSRESSCRQIYSLYDAASLVSTSPLDLSDLSNAPDFTILSFYKIFGYLDLGGLIIRKASGDILKKRRYFGGGTVDMVITGNEPWHSVKDDSYHARLEDGTVPLHSIIGLDLALKTHMRLYGSMREVSLHTSHLAETTVSRLTALEHSNGETVCHLYKPENAHYGPNGSLGPIIAFNLKNSDGSWIGKSEVEKLASIKTIQLRTGTLCNPGGTASYLGLTAEEMRRNYSMGQRCGDEHDFMAPGRPTGVLRISFGAMSTMADVDAFVNFVEEFYVDRMASPPSSPESTVTRTTTPDMTSMLPRFHIESLTVFPIKSCAGYKIPPDQPWEVRPEGLAWDREWCLIHQGTGCALSQKRYPRMALLQPKIDLKNRTLRISHVLEGDRSNMLEIPLSEESNPPNSPYFKSAYENISIRTEPFASKVCGDTIQVQLYTSCSISTFFSQALGVPCTLARFPPRSRTSISSTSTPREVKLRPHNSRANTLSDQQLGVHLLSNESPILLVSRASLNHLNSQINMFRSHESNETDKIKSTADDVPIEAFRGNIVIAQDSQVGSPYAEDSWSSITLCPFQDTLELSPEMKNNTVKMQVLGKCSRCQMINVPQQRLHSNGQKFVTQEDRRGLRTNQEPYSTLAKTRRWDGGVWFGVHLAPVILPPDSRYGREVTTTGDAIDQGTRPGCDERSAIYVRTGDMVIPST